ncbi:MAG: hypothetical protein LBG15_08130 [Dysgonamonadaceae bacterium]|jgi:hypothetical protein|nr:hypothetical protein [Dysgonamonadaceae bacterium]
MKNSILLLFLFTGLVHSTFAQVKIGNNADNIKSSSLLELESPDKGLLITRLTTEQINAIQNPATGLLIYNTDLNLLQVNIGTEGTPQWYNIAITHITDNKEAILLPVGTDADRPASPVDGMLRYNTSLSEFEKYENGNWISLE